MLHLLCNTNSNTHPTLLAGLREAPVPGRIHGRKRLNQRRSGAVMATIRTRQTNVPPSSTSPTSAWEIPELVAEIMKHNCDARPALAACAAVSRAFSEPALEVLWETMEEVNPLFTILTKSIEMIPGRGATWKKTFILSAPIDDQEWDRFVRYANLVRVYINRGDNIDGMTSRELMARTQGESLLPRLQDLTWIRPVKHSSSLPLFLSPHLRTLFMDLSNDITRESLRRGDRESGPTMASMRDLTVHGATSPYTLETIGTFRHLRSLKLHTIWDLRSLSSCLKPLAGLESLMVGIQNDAANDRVDNLPLDASPLPLEDLRSLHVVGPPRFVYVFLVHAHLPALQHLSVSTACDNVMWKRCIRIAASRFSNTLLSFEAWLHDTPNDTSIRTFRDLFSPLYAIRTLQELTIKHFRQTECLITTDDIADIVKAWPDLRSLALLWSEPKDGPRPPTLPITALESIARSCRSLRTLILPLPDPSPLSNLELPSVTSYDNHVFVMKLLGGKWKRKARGKCIRYLTHIFPRLDRHMIWMDEDYEAMFHSRGR